MAKKRFPKPKKRKGVRPNPDGTESTHLMRREYVPGRGWVAFPSLFQNKDKSWVDMSDSDGYGKPYEEAVRRKEVYDFGEDEEAATRFADEGVWKQKGKRQKYQKGTVGIKPPKATRQDSLDVYNNALELKEFYDNLSPYYDKPKIQGFNIYDKKKIESGEIQEDTLKHEDVTEKNKSIIRANNNPNIQYMSDMITGAIDPDAPLLRYDSRIQPQGEVSYKPKGSKAYRDYYSKAYRDKGINKLKYGTEEHATAIKELDAQLDKDKQYENLYSKLEAAGNMLPGYITTIPYYDPIAVAPLDMLTPEQRAERESKYSSNANSFNQFKSKFQWKNPVERVETIPARTIPTGGVPQAREIEIKGGEPTKETQDRNMFLNARAGEVEEDKTYWEMDPKTKKQRLVKGSESEADYGYRQYRDGVSELGYSDGSPYRNEPYLDIDTPSGMIDMSNTSIPIRANGRLLPPNSGQHQFEPGIVREEPAYQDGTNRIEVPYSGEADEEGNLPSFVEGSTDRPTLIEGVEAKTDAPEWLEYVREYKDQNKFSKEDGKKWRSDYEKTSTYKDWKGKVNADYWREEGWKEYVKSKFNKRNKRAYEYSVDKIKKVHPKGDMSRQDWFKQFDPYTENLIKQVDPREGIDSWTKFQKGLETVSPVWNAVGLTEGDYTEMELEQRKAASENSPIMSKISDATGVLEPLSITGKLGAAGMNKLLTGTVYDRTNIGDYGFGDALAGRDSGNPLVEAVSDPLNFIGVGEVMSAFKGSKAALGALSKVGKFKNLNKVDDIVRAGTKLKLNPATGLLEHADDLKQSTKIIDPSVGKPKYIIDPTTGRYVPPKQAEGSFINDLVNPKNSPIEVIANRIKEGPGMDAMMKKLAKNNPKLYGSGFIESIVAADKAAGHTPAEINQYLRNVLKQQRKQKLKKVGKTIKDKVSKIPDVPKNLRDAYVGGFNVAGEVLGELRHGKANLESIEKGNKWLGDWISDPITQAKMRQDLGAKFQTPEMQFLSQYKPEVQQYPIKHQIGENINQWLSPFSGAEPPMHQGNLGVSYTHSSSPLQKLGVHTGDIDRPKWYGGWTSRKTGLDQAKRELTTIHEGTHDWIPKETLAKSGQFTEVKNMLDPESRKIFEEWKSLRDQGYNSGQIRKIMGRDRAYTGYMSNPTEMHARIMELRKQGNLKPNEIVTPEKVDEIYNTVKNKKGKYKTNIDGMLHSFGADLSDESWAESKRRLAYLMNRMWAAAPATVATGVGVKMATDEKKKKKKMGSDRGYEYKDGTQGVMENKYKLGCFSVSKKYEEGTKGVYGEGTNYVDYGEGEFGYQKMEVPPSGGPGNILGNAAAGAQLGANFGPWGALAGTALGIGKGLIENNNIAAQAGRVKEHNLSLREFKRDDEEFQVMQAEEGLSLDYVPTGSDIDTTNYLTNHYKEEQALKYQDGTGYLGAGRFGPLDEQEYPQYNFGTAALNALPGAMDFFGVDKNISQPISSLANTYNDVYQENREKMKQVASLATGGAAGAAMNMGEQANQLKPMQGEIPAVPNDPILTDTLRNNPDPVPNMIPIAEKGYGMARRGKKRIEAEGDEIVMRRGKGGKYMMKRFLKGPSHAEGGIDMIAEEGDVIFPKKMKKEVMEAYKNNDNLRLESLRSKLPKDTPNGPQTMAKHGKFIMHSRQPDFPTKDISKEVAGYNNLKYQGGVNSIGPDPQTADDWRFGVIDEDEFDLQSGYEGQGGGFVTNQEVDGVQDTTPMQGYRTAEQNQQRARDKYRESLTKDKLYMTGGGPGTGRGSGQEGGYRVRDFYEAMDRGEYNFGDQKASSKGYQDWLKKQKEFEGKNQHIPGGGVANPRDAEEVYNLRKSYFESLYDPSGIGKTYDPEVELDKPESYQKQYDPWEHQWKGADPDGGDGPPQDPRGPQGPGGYPLPKAGGDIADKIRMGAPSLYNIGMGWLGNPDIEARRFLDPEQRKYVDMSAEDRAANLRNTAAARKGSRDHYMSRGQRHGVNTQIGSRYLDQAGKINQAEARRFDQIDAQNKMVRNQAQQLNIGQADLKDDLDDRNRAAKQRMLAKGLEQQSDLGKFNRMERFMRGREARLYDTDMRRLEIEAWRAGIDDPSKLPGMGDTGGYGGYGNGGYNQPPRSNTKPTGTTTTPSGPTTPTTPTAPQQPTKVRKVRNKIKQQIQQTTDPNKKRDLRKKLKEFGDRIDDDLRDHRRYEFDSLKRQRDQDLRFDVGNNALISRRDHAAGIRRDYRGQRRYLADEYRTDKQVERENVRKQIARQKGFREDYEDRENKRRVSQNIRRLRRYGTY